MPAEVHPSKRRPKQTSEPSVLCPSSQCNALAKPQFSEQWRRQQLLCMMRWRWWYESGGIAGSTCRLATRATSQTLRNKPSKIFDAAATLDGCNAQRSDTLIARRHNNFAVGRFAAQSHNHRRRCVCAFVPRSRGIVEALGIAQVNVVLRWHAMPIGHCCAMVLWRKDV